jgi:sugar/nucleoside kinase (ribokinase family)
LVITSGSAGAIGIQNGVPCRVDVKPVAKIVDTTGAGDMFAAGFLAAHCRGHPLARCLDAGACAAAEVITHFGARPEGDLMEWVDL